MRRTIWLTRPDLRRRFASEDGAEFDSWLTILGGDEYAGLAQAGCGVPKATMVEAAPGALRGVRPRLTLFMTSLHRLRSDLRRRYDLSTLDGQQRFVWWLLIDGAREHAACARAALAACESDGLLREPAEAERDTHLPGIALTRFMKLVWDMRPDLQAAFDIATPSGRTELAWWFFLFGPAELGLDRYLTDPQRRFLAEPDDAVVQAGVAPLTRLMMRVWSTRADLQQAYPLDSASGQTRYAAWFYTRGATELGLLPHLLGEAVACLAMPAHAGDRLSRILALLWIHEAQLRERFPDPRDAAFAAWSIDEGPATYPVLALVKGHSAGPAAPAVRSASRRAQGYNLIGYARGQLGIGEDVRMAALAMQAAGVPFSIYNIEPGREVCQGDDSAAAFVSDRLPYDTNLFCTTGIETARIAAVEGSRLFDGRRSIGYWPWELPEWPRAWWHAYDLVDEVWASSDYSLSTYRRSSPKPVRHMPMAVTADASAGLTRRDFRLPLRRFLFVFSFDALSGFARKNPLACVTAFREAFPRGDEPAGLVVKVMRARRGDANWEAFRAAAAGDRRIRVINRTLDRGAVLDLYRACDCFVSLHRAEGFGRGIAEAMLLGKPVIVTGWSGNMDFTSAETAALVEYRLVPVREGDYPFAEGQLWADVGPSHAAWWMRRIAGDEPLRRRLAEAGQALVRRRYGPSAVGRRYASRLERMAA